MNLERKLTQFSGAKREAAEGGEVGVEAAVIVEIETEKDTPAEAEEEERMNGGRKVMLSSRSCLVEEEEEQLLQLIQD